MRVSQQQLTTDGELLLILLRKAAADLDLQRYEVNKLRYRLRQAQELASPLLAAAARHRQAATDGSALST